MGVKQAKLSQDAATASKHLLAGTKLLLTTATLVIACATYSSIHRFNNVTSCTPVRLSVGKVGSKVASSGTTAEKYIPPPRTQACSEDVTGIKFIVDGLEVQRKQIVKALRAPLSEDRLHSIQVTGACGGFSGKSNLGPIFLRPKSSDIPVFMAVWIYHEFAFLDDLFAKQGIVPKRIMDLGMNCGMASLYFTTHFPDAQVIAVEPGMESFMVASLNLVHHPNVIREVAAIEGQGGGYDQLVDRKKGAWGMGVDSVSLSRMTLKRSFGSIEVPYLMRKYGWKSIDYLKVDIEGSEKGICDAILEGKADWIKTVSCATFEYHDRFVEGVSVTCDAAMKMSGFKHVGHEGELTVWCRS